MLRVTGTIHQVPTVCDPCLLIRVVVMFVLNLVFSMSQVWTPQTVQPATLCYGESVCSITLFVFMSQLFFGLQVKSRTYTAPTDCPSSIYTCF